MAKLLFINPVVREEDVPRHIPYGIALLASIALKDGHDVQVYDANAWRLSDEVLKAIGYFTGSTCKKMEGKVAVGVIFIESSIDGGPKFKSTDKTILLANLYKAHSYLTNKKPEPKNLSWYYDIQNIKIEEEDRGRGINSLSDNYFKYEAMKKVVYNGKTFFGNILGVDNYLDLLKSDKKCDYSVMYFITP